MADIKTLEKLAETMQADMKKGYHGLNCDMVINIAYIIEDAIGAPLMWPSREAGCNAAAEYYPASPDLRHAFNAGVKWAVENYQPSKEPSKRYESKDGGANG